MAQEDTLRDLLRAYRKSMGWTQQEVAVRWNYSFETISAWERGKRTPSVQEIPRIANLLGLPAEDLARCIREQSVTNSMSQVLMREPASASPASQAWHTAFATWGELVHIYRNRTEFHRDFSYPRMLEDAVGIVAVGISLNVIALTYSSEEIIRAIVERQATFHLCFLDPDGDSCKQREKEEELPEGTIAALTRTNIYHVLRIRQQLAAIDQEYVDRLRVSTYDFPPRYNIITVDDVIMTVQSYGYGRGEDTPTLVLTRQIRNGLFEFYASAATYTLQHARAVPVVAEATIHARRD